MILPSQKECAHVIEELDGSPDLTEWELRFCASNRGRVEFTDAQREVVARLQEKYDC